MTNKAKKLLYTAIFEAHTAFGLTKQINKFIAKNKVMIETVIVNHTPDDTEIYATVLYKA